MRLAYFCCAVLCLFCALPAHAQSDFDVLNLQDSLPVVDMSRPVPTRFLELGVSANSYKGDLGVYEKWTACYHAAIRFNGQSRLNGRVGFGFGFITGENRFYKFPQGKPNNFFRTPIVSISYEGQYNLIKTRSFMLYASAGIGFLNYLPKNEQGERLIDLLETRATDESYGRMSIILPIGMGATYLLKNNYAVGVQAQWLNTQTDYLDNISEWGTRDGKDNIASIRFYIYAPLQFFKPTLTPFKSKAKPQKHYSHEF